MNGMRKTMHVATGACLLFLTGCASFQGKQLQPVQAFPETRVKKSVHVDMDFAQTLNGKETSLFRKSVEENLEKKCIKRMNRSKMFGEVSGDMKNPDLTVAIALVDKGEYNTGDAILTGLTLFIYPSSATDTYHMRARVTETRTGRQSVIDLSDSVTMWQEILLLPLLPFKFPSYEANKCINTMFDNLCIEIHRSGLLDASRL